tara:strand:- start:403 stop:567 length:165 start_codon:yes stop_codon:yes gene_type:complete
MSKKINYKEWLKWREEYYKKNSHISNKEELAKGQQQMETWEKYLKEEDSGHRPC